MSAGKPKAGRLKLRGRFSGAGDRQGQGRAGLTVRMWGFGLSLRRGPGCRARAPSNAASKTGRARGGQGSRGAEASHPGVGPDALFPDVQKQPHAPRQALGIVEFSIRPVGPHGGEINVWGKGFFVWRRVLGGGGEGSPLCGALGRWPCGYGTM
jgi:hypothetical protein